MDMTHEVFNQPDPLVGYNLFNANRPLQDALKFNAPGLDTAELRQLGARLGTQEMQAHARLANVHPPRLHTHDRFGRRIDQVEFHPSYHALMALSIGAGLHSADMAPTLPAARGSLPLQGATPPETAHLQAVQARAGGLGAAAFSPEGAAAPVARQSRFHGPDLRESSAPVSIIPTLVASGAALSTEGDASAGGGSALNPQSPSPHTERAVGFMLFTELEPSSLCPISMTYAATPALRGNPAIHAAWAPRLASRQYDPALKPWHDKAGVTMGMGMTEKQGGSDVRANTTRAAPDGVDAWGQRFAVAGHKWFFSAPMCDAFLILAQTPSGLSCLFLPRVLPDGTLNAIHLQRLKDKLGNKANASSEVEFSRATAWLVGEEGRGVPQILAMGTMTRLDCALGTSGLMRQALSLALDHTAQRQAFGKPLLAQPLMRNVLADLAIESEAACALSIRLASTFDHQNNTHEQALSRLLTPVAKFWICKRGSAFAQEAMECLGGNGYVEEGGECIMARIYREMPVNSIWEGAGNIMALDLLRALRKPEAVAALAQELSAARGAHAALDRLAAVLPLRIEEMASELQARRLAQDVALALQAALLCQGAPNAVADAFCNSRLAGERGQTFGTLAAGTDFDSIIERAMPR
ncbi:MAG: acyl-CoA dehydrogenase domain protein [Polaromonas sp.]|nr:acyl-CoA dehydrogenase domain protein [Polaromonas sp.]